MSFSYSGLASVYSSPVFWCSTKVDGRGVLLVGGGHWGICGKGCPQVISISQKLQQSHVGSPQEQENEVRDIMPFDVVLSSVLQI